MGCANRKGRLPEAHQALVAEHEAKLEDLAREYVAKVEAVQAARDKSIAALRATAARELIQLVAGFEKKRSAMLVRFALECERTHGGHDTHAAEQTPRRARRSGAN